MANLNGMGPQNQGAMTGRAMGNCGKGMPKMARTGVGFGQGMGYGRGRGCGRGFGCWGGYAQSPMTKDEEKEVLKSQRQAMQDNVADIDKRLNDLES